MTRINLIHPSELCDKHLMAEYRELIRIPNAVYTGKMKTKYDDAPDDYVLGEGHVKFFVNKMMWLFKRHAALYDELCYREYNVTEMIWGNDRIKFFIDNGLFNDYTPTDIGVRMNIRRIMEQLPEVPRWAHREEPMYYFLGSL